MTGKRYFKRMWEEEFYIFDSEIISENEFDEKVEYEDYQAFADSMLGDEVVGLLNELYEENERLKSQLYCNNEEGVCNICKHHYLVKDDEVELAYYTSRCKKGHYECARVSLKYCEDFEKELKE